MIDLKELTVKTASEKLASGEFTSKELAEASLKRIDEVDAQIHAFLKVTQDKALADAAKADEGLISPISGIPYAVKDNILVKGIQASAASKILENYKATYNATIINKLEANSPVLIGKTNLDEFAMGSSTENSAFGPTRNPYDLTRVPGGSSGGSAAAVASSEVLFALGSDTGGSVRQPASMCGVVGLKPTYGRVSRFGLIAMGSSLDQIGVFTKTVEDNALVFGNIAGQDEYDTTSLPKPVPDYTQFLDKDIRGLKVGIPQEFFAEGIDVEVKEVIDSAVEKFRELGAEIIEISLPSTKYALACYYLIMPVEVSANLSRFDGIRYGLSVPAEKLEEVYTKTRSAGFGSEAKRRIIIGTYASSAGYFDAYYKKAKIAQNLIRREFNEAFKKVDVMLTPTSPIPAFKLEEKVSDPLSMYLADIFTVSLNIAGVPGICVPAGTTSQGLPVGLQIIAGHFEEGKLFHTGYAFEQAIQLKINPKI